MMTAMTDRRLRRGDHDRRMSARAAITVAIAIGLDRAIAALPAGVAVPGLGPALDHDGAARIAGGGVVAGVDLSRLGAASDQNRRSGGGVK
jgi:hypothetical protein